MTIHRYEIKIGNDVFYSSRIKELKKKDVVDLLISAKVNERTFYGKELDWESLSKRVARVSPRTFRLEYTEPGEDAIVLDLKKISIKEIAYYDNCEENEVVHDFLVKQSLPYQNTDLGELINQLELTNDQFMSQVVDLVNSKWLKFIYSIDEEDWDKDLGQLREYEMHEIRIGIRKE